MATDVTLLQAELRRIERELETVRSKLEKLTNGEPSEPRPFSRLRGMAKGADLSQDEIKAHHYTIPDDDQV